MVLFGSLLDQFVSSLDRANGLSIFQFDAIRAVMVVVFPEPADARIL